MSIRTYRSALVERVVVEEAWGHRDSNDIRLGFPTVVFDNEGERNEPPIFELEKIGSGILYDRDDVAVPGAVLVDDDLVDEVVHE